MSDKEDVSERLGQFLSDVGDDSYLDYEQGLMDGMDANGVGESERREIIRLLHPGNWSAYDWRRDKLIDILNVEGDIWE